MFIFLTQLPQIHMGHLGPD